MDPKYAGTLNLDYLLAVASDRIGVLLEKSLRKRGVPVEFWRILACLQDRQGLTMGELANKALLSLPKATRFVDRMVSEALVYRVASPSDRRIDIVFRSGKGRAVWAEVKADVDDMNRRLVETLGEEWIEDLAEKLGQLVKESESIPGCKSHS